MSEYLEIRGGRPLKGEIAVSGAKNAALPVLIASLLTAEKCTVKNVPNLEDVTATIKLIRRFGASVEYRERIIGVQVPEITSTTASYSLVKSLRASFWVLGPLLARRGCARVALPGGDAIGGRPVDMHLKGLARMGAEVTVRHGVVLADAPTGLHPAEIEFGFPSVGATHQILLAASLTPGETVIKNAACEPEVAELARFLSFMGAEIEGAGTKNIVVHGRRELGGADITLIGDRIEAGTYLLAAAAAGGGIKTVGVDPVHLGGFLNLLGDMGLEIETGADWIQVRKVRGLKGVKVSTAPFPGVATDLQAPLMAALCTAVGESEIEENVFEGRFSHVRELRRMGADVTVEDRRARIRGVGGLNGAHVEGSDIRGAAALVVAALGASGITCIHELQHLKRGYETLPSKLSGTGASVGVKIEDIDDALAIGC